MRLIREKGPGPITDGLKGFSGLKSTASAVVVNEELLAKINRYALQPLTAEDIFIGKKVLAHNGVDRDRERFPEEMLKQFAATLPGKSTLYFHDRNKFLPLGLYFDAATETISAETFKEMTGADAKLPAGIDNVMVVWAWYYVVKTPDIDSVLKNIAGGVYRHWSIGFMAADLVAVKQEINGPVLYWEYVAPGEATEGSLVWLGAQQGATSQKHAGRTGHKITDKNSEGGSTMELKQRLGALLGKTFGENDSEEHVLASVKTALEAKDTEITGLKGQVTTLDGKVKELEPLAAEGKSFRDGLVDDYARMKSALGECDNTDDAKNALKKTAKSLDVAFLKGEVKHLQTRMEAKFPGGQLDADDPNQNRGKGSNDNPLVPTDDK